MLSRRRQAQCLNPLVVTCVTGFKEFVIAIEGVHHGIARTGFLQQVLVQARPRFPEPRRKCPCGPA